MRLAQDWGPFRGLQPYRSKYDCKRFYGTGPCSNDGAPWELIEIKTNHD